MSYFPQRLRELPPFEGPFDAVKLEAKNCDVLPKLKRTVAGDIANSAMALVARGEAEIGVATIATIFAPGIDFVGPLPAELQAYNTFAAGVSVGARDPKAAAALIKFVTAPPAAAAFKKKGMESAPQR